MTGMSAMIRSIFLVFGLTLAAAPVAAASYSATLAVPVAGRFIARDITWDCGASACEGVTEESRPLVLCESLAKRAGRVENFLADGRALTGTELDRCNASARAEPGKALAANRSK
jgi:hypothetical protein